MRVILQEKVAKLGKVGDQVEVKPGYGRNYLIPNGIAVPATEKNIAEFEKRRIEFEKKAAEVLTVAQARAEKLKDLTVTIEVQASEEGKLFGSVGLRDVVDAVSKQGIDIEKREVLLPEGPIRQVGEYAISLQLHSEVVVAIKVKIVAASV